MVFSFPATIKVSEKAATLLFRKLDLTTYTPWHICNQYCLIVLSSIELHIYILFKPHFLTIKDFL